jgi:hypothetical protein
LDAQSLLGASASQQRIIPGPASTAEIQGLPEGQWYFGARTAAVNGRISDLSSNIVGAAVGPDPEPPIDIVAETDDGELTVTTDTQAYNPTKRPDLMRMEPVGSVPVGTLCSAQEIVVAQGVTYFGVARASVSWFGLQRPDVVYARDCR